MATYEKTAYIFQCNIRVLCITGVYCQVSHPL